MTEARSARWKEIATSFLKVGATAYGGPAIMGVMQAEFQERRQWVTKPRFLEGLALVNVFAGVGAFTFGGGLSMIALVEEQVVDRLRWLTPEEFIAGLALGQLTPGPVLMVAAYVGYKLLGVRGAVAAAAAAFLPSFAL